MKITHEILSQLMKWEFAGNRDVDFSIFCYDKTIQSGVCLESGMPVELLTDVIATKRRAELQAALDKLEGLK